jgi:N12 class adenine-specific DNA methylase
MALKWTDIANSDTYKNADPEFQSKVQEKFFNDVVQKAPGYKSEFDTKIRESLFGTPALKPKISPISLKDFSLTDLSPEQRQGAIMRSMGQAPDTDLPKPIQEVKEAFDVGTVKGMTGANIESESAAKHPGIAVAGEIGGSVMAFMSPGGTLAKFSLIPAFHEITRQITTPEEDLSPVQRGVKVSTAGFFGLLTGKVFKDAEAGKTILSRISQQAAGAGSNAITESIVQDTISGRDPDVKKAFISGGMSATTIAIIGAMSETPELRGLVWDEARAQVGKPKLSPGSKIGETYQTPKTYEEAKVMVEETSMRSPEELSPTLKSAIKEQKVATAQKMVKQDMAYYRDKLGWNEKQLTEFLNIKNANDFDTMAGAYSKVNPKFVETILPYRDLILSGKAAPEDIIIGLELNKLLQPKAKVEQVVEQPKVAEPQKTPIPDVSRQAETIIPAKTEIIPPAAGGEVEYHGTTPENAQNIIKSGKFRVGEGQAGVSTTQDYEEALDYANGDPKGVIAVRVRDGAEMVGKEGKDFLTGTGSWKPEDVTPIQIGNLSTPAVEKSLPPEVKKIEVPKFTVEKSENAWIVRNPKGEIGLITGTEERAKQVAEEFNTGKRVEGVSGEAPKKQIKVTKFDIVPTRHGIEAPITSVEYVNAAGETVSKPTASPQKQAVEYYVNEYVNKLSKETNAPREAYENLAQKIVTAIESKDVVYLRSILNGINPNSNKLFTQITGLPARLQREVDVSLRSMNPESWDASKYAKKESTLTKPESGAIPKVEEKKEVPSVSSNEERNIRGTLPGDPGGSGGGGSLDTEVPSATLAKPKQSVKSEVKRERSKSGNRESTPQQRAVNLGNYRITDTDQIGQGTPKVKYQLNISAIKLLKTLEKENRKATPEEQSVLVKYAGWGSLSKVFNRYSHEGWDKEFKELESLLTDEEYEAARRSTINAHYTSQEIIEAIWKAVQSIGFNGGKVLEPAMGIGHFIGLRPEGMNISFTGVELDSLTGRIAKQLYQGADLYIEGFEKVHLSKDFYDLAISNVPFADYRPYDAKAKYLGIPSGLMLHDYFFAKSMALVKPGGIVSFITSKGTMDKQDPQLRGWLSERADLLGAIRLPVTAFKANAGTEVVTDIIFLRKRLPGEQVTGEEWKNSSQTKISNRNINVNQYFIKNTAMVLGNMKIGRGLYSNDELRVEPLPEPLADSLDKAIDFLPKNVIKQQADIVEAEKAEETISDSSNTKNEAYKVQNGKIYQKTEGGLVAKDFGEDNARLIGISEVRDAARNLLAKQMVNAEDNAFKSDIEKLNKAYDKFVKKHGFLNSPKNEKVFEDDPDAPLVLSLETEDKVNKTFLKGAIFSKRVTHHHVRPTSAGSAQDAVYISLSEYGHLNWNYMADITGKSAEILQGELSAQGNIFKNPEGEKWELSDEYLSGDVKLKLKLAEAATKIDPSYNTNIEALRSVQPADLAFKDISVRIGTPWVEADDYRAFISELLEVSGWSVIAEHNKVDGRFNFELEGWGKGSANNINKWGTARFPAVNLIEAIANHRTIKVTDRVKQGGQDVSVTNEQETAVAQDKAEILKQKFSDWFWQDEQRRDKYVRLYNDQYNNIVIRKYSGDHLTLPGLSNVYKLRKTQLDAIWRGITSQTLLLAHEVGAGKTAIVVCTVMESKRLGIINKPFVVVPKNTLSQWKREFNKLYPAANILVADEKNFTANKRKKFLGRIATGNYDAIVLSDSSNYLIGVSDNTYAEYIQEKLDDLRAEKERLQDSGSKITVKQIEKSILKLEERLKEKLDQSKKDETVVFEELGVDAIFVDEADTFKNLAYTTKMENVRGLGAPQGNKSTEDMMMKIRQIRKKVGKVVFATGTPISNSMAEVHSMMKYLQPDALAEKGLTHFDDWANAFGETVTSLEVDATGGRYKAVTRFSKFVNVPELMAMLRQVWDIQTAEMLEKAGILVKGVNLPLIRGGKATPAVLPPIPELQAYIQELGARADKIKGKRVEKGGDNMLVILHDGIMASTDMRLIDPSLPGHPDSKIETSINGIFERWNKYKDDRSTQIIFMDRVAPNDKVLFNPQYYMRRKLIEMGIPEKEIAFIHEYDSMDEKSILYDKMNSGEVRILFGSTEKLGAGTNVQERLICLWHLDTPFRPRDIVQREGRIVRPGNGNKEVEIMRMVTKGSLDTFMWQMLEAKKKAIDQVMSGESSSREIVEDVDEYAIIKAASSDNPLLKEKTELDREVRRLTNLKNAFLEQKFKSQKEVKSLPVDIQKIKQNIEDLKTDIAKRPEKPTKETFTVEVAGKPYTTKEEAWKAIKSIIDGISVAQWGKDIVPLGTYQNFKLFVFITPPTAVTEKKVSIQVKGQAYQYDASFSESAIGTFASIDSALYTQPEARITVFTNNLDLATKQLQIAGELSNKNFEHEKTLDEKSRRQVEVNRLLKKEAEGKSAQEIPEDEDLMEMHMGLQLIPTKKKPYVNDHIETGEVKFTDPETERRFKEAHGQHPDNLKFKIGKYFEDFKNRATRVYPELPNEARFSHIKEIIRRQAAAREIAQAQAMQNINNMTYGFGPNKLYLFTQKVVLDDLIKEAESGRPIPFGYSSYDEGGALYTDTAKLMQDKQNVDDRIALNPDVAAAVLKRKDMWKQITGDLVRYKILSPDQLKEDYYRHQILDYARNKATFGTGKKLKTPTPGYAKRRFGSAELDINTNFIEAEFEVMSQALLDIQTALNIDKIRNSPLNIKNSLRDQARLMNDQVAIAMVVPGVTNDKGEPVTVKDILKQFSNKMGFGFAALEKAGYAFPKDDPESFKEVARLANDPDAPEDVQIAARMILKAMADRKAALKGYLGKNYKEWGDLIPPGYAKWQPQEGRVFYSATSVSQKIINEVLDGVAIEGLDKDDLRKIMAVGGMREEFVLPEEVSKTLNELYTIKPSNMIANGARFLTSQWKKWVLFNPRRVVKYNFQNFIGDSDAVIAGQPRIFKNFMKANQALIDVFYKGKPMPPEMREFFERGGLDRNMTIQEIPDINKLGMFERFITNSNKAFDLRQAFSSINAYWGTVIDFTMYRESILRYAAYLYYRDVFKAGKVEYGASLRNEIDGLSDPLDKAARVATELLGDYGNITALGKDLRDTTIPFYSWYEINFKRYKRLTQNAFDEGFGAGAKKQLTIGSLIMLRLILKAIALTAIVALWNQIMFRDEEKDLSPYDQNRMHITVGRDKNGRPRIIRGQSAFSDLMEWVGLDQLPTLWRDYFDGKASMVDIFGKIPFVTGKIGLKPIFLKFMRGINPFYKVAAETVTGKTVFGLDERSGRIEDKTRNALKALQLENEYDWITKKPSRGYLKSLWEAIITTTDPEENAFRYIQGQKYAFMEQQGRGGSGDYYTPRSIVYRQYKKALVYKDVEAQKTALKTLSGMGVTVEELQRSVATQEPLYGLKDEDKAKFVKEFLTTRDRELLRRAYFYYVKTFLRTEPSR